MNDYRSGYGNGKALGHAMHNEAALAVILEARPNEPPDYRRGLEDGFRDGWDAWQYEVQLSSTSEGVAMLRASWEQRFGKRYKPPESEATA